MGRTEDMSYPIEDQKEILQALLQSAPDAVVVVDQNGQILCINAQTENLFGYKKNELIGREVEMLLPERVRSRHSSHRQKYIQHPRTRPMGIGLELSGLHKDGQEFPVEISLSPVETGRGLLVSAAIRDISYKRKVEDQVRRANNELSTINRIVAACTSTLNLKEILEITLDESLAISQLEGGTICLITDNETLHLAAERAASDATIQDLTTHDIKIGECLCGNCAKDLKPLILWDRDSVINYASRESQRDEKMNFHASFPLATKGKCVGVLCIFTRTERKPDARGLRLIETLTSQVAIAIENARLYEETLNNAVTLEKKVEERTGELRESEEKFRKLAENINEVFWMSAPDGTKVLYVSPAFEEIWGVNRDELYENPLLWMSTIKPEYRADVEKSFQHENLMKGGFDVEYEIQRPDGSSRWIHDRGFPVLEGNEIKSIAGIAMDITTFKEMDRLKSMFIASMSHELRTPLNSIIGFTGIILQGMAGDINAEQNDMLQRSYGAAKHLLGLISDVIDISKIEAGKIEPFTEEFMLGELIHEVVSTMLPELDKKNLTVDARGDQEIAVKTDRKRLLQCLLNYVSNAVKYSEKGGITLTVNDKKERIEIVVEDTGIGIKKEDMPRLFHAFVRLDSPLHIKNRGTGLGLYLTRKLAHEVLQGEAYAESTLGKGSRFILDIPKKI